jgi:hypothetical protein
VGSRASVSQTFKSACSEPFHPFMDSPGGYPEFSSYKRRHLALVDDSAHNMRTAVKASPCVGMELHDCVPSRQDQRQATVERFSMHVCVWHFSDLSDQVTMSVYEGTADVVFGRV